MSKWLILGAGGFIGGHLFKAIEKRFTNDTVYGCDIKPYSKWFQSAPKQKQFCIDLTQRYKCQYFIKTINPDIVVNLASDMGGMPYIGTHRLQCMSSARINMNVIEALHPGIRYFFASSACVYPPMTSPSKESDVWPANPEPGYGLEKLFSEQYTMESGLNYRIARFHNVYGPYCSVIDGREKAPAALCRKIALAKRTGAKSIQIIGDGTAKRTFLYVDDCCRGILDLIVSNRKGPYNIGSEYVIDIQTLAYTIMEIAGYHCQLDFVPGQVGVEYRSSDNRNVGRDIGWMESISLSEGLSLLYNWVEECLIKTWSS